MPSLQCTVPDTSADTSVAAVQLSAVSGGLTNYTTLTVATATTVWMLVSAIPAPLASPPVLAPTVAAVLALGMPLRLGAPISFQITPASQASPDPAQVFFATASGDGAGDARACDGCLA